MTLEIVPAYDRKEEIKELFAEYTDMLVKTDPLFAKYLAIQGYDDELKDLERNTACLTAGFILPYGKENRQAVSPCAG